MNNKNTNINYKVFHVGYDIFLFISLKIIPPRTPSRSKSPGLFGSTFASRAKQREAIGTPLVRSRANSVCSMPNDAR